MTTRGRLLLVDDDEAACRLLAEVLQRDGHEVETALAVDEALATIDRTGPFDAVVTDLRMPNASGLDLLRTLRERDPDAIVILVTAFGDASVTAEAINAGAYDFISKPYDLALVRETIGRALQRRGFAIRHREEGDAPAAAPVPGHGEEAPVLVGRSPAIIAVMKTLARVARSQATVLLQGESGTGKELAARALHHLSDRADRPLVVVNCGALTETLLESELFGHVKGAFTGAANARPGMFREAHRGTIFLDEIGDVSPALQTRLLRAVQEKVVQPVGSEASIAVDVRVIAATNRDLAELVRAGTFREDLYYRLNVVTVTLPPLRERRQDIPLLVDHFIRRLAQRHGRGPIAIDPEAEVLLAQYDWPGNVRQLQNVLERAVVLAEQGVIGPEHLVAEVTSPTPASSLPTASSPPLAAAVGAPGPAAGPTPVTLADVEREHVLRVLESAGGRREVAAKALGISRRTLTRMLQRWQIDFPRH
jgi:DNA-binding NtrC family response regulator